MMKKCPKCNRAYSDETLNFCLDDGVSLIRTGDEVETVVISNRNNKLKFLVPITIFILLFLFGSVAIGLFQFRDSIASIFNSDPRPTPVSLKDPEITSENAADQEILDTLKKVRKAYVDDDYETLDEIMGEEYVEENSYGQKLTKKQILSPVLIGKRKSLKHSNIKIEFETEDEASVNGRGVSKGEVGGIEVTYRFAFKTDFEKRGGRWKTIYSYIDFQ